MAEANRARSGALARRVLGTFLSLAVLSLFLLPGVGAAGPKERVQEAKARLAGIEKDLQAQEGRLARLQGDIAVKATELNAAQAEWEVTQQLLIQTRQELNAARAHIEELQEQLDQRAEAAYLNSTSAGLEFLLASSSLTELTDRMQILDAVSAEDAELAALVANEAAQLRFKQQRLDRLQAKQAAAIEEIEEEQAQLEESFAEAEAILADIRQKREQARKAARQAQIDYQNWLEEQRRLAQEAAQQAAQQGAVVGGPGPFKACPVGSPRGVSDSFGAPRSGGRLHMGVDIFAPQDTPIYAPFDGTARASSNSLGGYAVYVYGAGGYVYNAHLSRPSHVSGSVKAGQVIGYVGTTGNAIGTSPHNHFEWHPNATPSNVPPSPYGYAVLGSAVNSYPYLRLVCG